jgi:hypothetical protein
MARRKLKIVALIAGAASLMFSIFRRRSTRKHANRSIDLGPVSERWLAEQRGLGDQSQR